MQEVIKDTLKTPTKSKRDSFQKQFVPDDYHKTQNAALKEQIKLFKEKQSLWEKIHEEAKSEIQMLKLEHTQFVNQLQ